MKSETYPTSVNAVKLTANDTLYEFFDTEDGSPTVRRSDKEQAPEAMHHCGGALTESLYIYGEAIRYSVEHRIPLRIISVGLGLGYNEMISFALTNEPIKMISFEKDPILKNGFLNWLGLMPLDPSPLQDQLRITLNRVLNVVAIQCAVSPTLLIEKMRTSFLDKDWHVFSDVRELQKIDSTYHIVLFDAFSKKATPDLWSEEFFANFFKHYVRAPAVFATYASNGSGRRALKNYGFESIHRSGFQGKRESTFAVLQQV
jgi:hypothetical protein